MVNINCAFAVNDSSGERKVRCVMTVVEAAKKIGISPSKLYQLVAARAISHYRVGAKIIFSEADVDVYITGCRVGMIISPATAPRVRLKLKHLSLPG
jgi:excisionase family DNA binding protein